MRNRRSALPEITRTVDVSSAYAARFEYFIEGLKEIASLAANRGNHARIKAFHAISPTCLRTIQRLICRTQHFLYVPVDAHCDAQACSDGNRSAFRHHRFF